MFRHFFPSHSIRSRLHRYASTSSSSISSVRGMRDLFGEEMEKMLIVKNIFRAVSSIYDYKPIETPIVESIELFVRTLGSSSDVVKKEMYTLSDRNDHVLALRPENTAGIMRAILNHGLQHKLPLKVAYDGPMFRYERPQRGRFRQFTQIGVEHIGLEDPWSDVESIGLAHHFLQQLPVVEGEKTELLLNSLGDAHSREKYSAALLSFFESRKSQLSSDSQSRLESGRVLRILDSKDPRDQFVCSESPRLLDFLSEDSLKRFDTVCEGLKQLKIPFSIEPTLVRGLDYYSHSCFEFVRSDDDGAQNAILAGGRYDDLSVQLGCPTPLPAIGWAAGVERLVLGLRNDLDEYRRRPLFGIVINSMDEDDNRVESDRMASFEKSAMLISTGIRQIGGSVMWKMQNLRSLKKQLADCAQANCRFVLFIGGPEWESGSFVLRNMKTKRQDVLPKSEMMDVLYAHTVRLLMQFPGSFDTTAPLAREDDAFPSPLRRPNSDHDVFSATGAPRLPPENSFTVLSE